MQAELSVGFCISNQSSPPNPTCFRSDDWSANFLDFHILKEGQGHLELITFYSAQLMFPCKFSQNPPVIQIECRQYS